MRKKKLTHNQVIKLLKSFSKSSAMSPVGAKRWICGELLGSGVSRDVYALKQDPEHYVVKLSNDDNNFANIKEWLTWLEIGEFTNMSKWFVPCVTTTSTGGVLIMERVTSGKKKSDYPKHVPAFFVDLKIENFGFDKDGQLKCLDYGSCYYASRVIDPKKMRTAKWWVLAAYLKRRRAIKKKK